MHGIIKRQQYMTPNSTVRHRRLASLAAMMLGACVALAQGPNNSGTYYKPADGKSGKSLKTAMAEVIVDHSAISYSGLWKCFYTTDRRSDGKVWDMYSSATNYTMGGPQQGANYKKEGDSYNREHSMPKSWFNDARPMYTDLVHIVPTDGYVNNRRGNYPFGETNGEQYQSAGGFSKLGRSTTSGYSGTVFEPADEYKGDFARIYFYMVTCYEKRVATWQSDMLDGTAYPALSRWALDLLLRWAKEDPVSQKETERNEAVWELQGNRNPFVDYPGLEQYVWGDKTAVAFSYDHYDSDGPSAITEATGGRPATVCVYTIGGTMVRRDVDKSGALQGLPKGIYIISSGNRDGMEKSIVR